MLSNAENNHSAQKHILAHTSKYVELFLHFFYIYNCFYIYCSYFIYNELLISYPHYLLHNKCFYNKTNFYMSVLIFIGLPYCSQSSNLSNSNPTNCLYFYPRLPQGLYKLLLLFLLLLTYFSHLPNQSCVVGPIGRIYGCNISANQTPDFFFV